MKRILSIDGGGYLGLAAAEYIRLMEDHLGRFDLISGTSTGGIIACALALGTSPETIVDWYLDRGKKIFPHRILRKPIIVARPQRYSAKPLERALREFFGDTPLSDVRTPLLVPAHDMATGRLYLFREDKPHMVWEAARATSAAPTYFAPYEKQGKRVKHRWIDGGLYLNNPAMAAYIRARQLWPHEKYEIVSIGTGRESLAMKKPIFVWQWIPKLIRIGVSGSANKDEFMVKFLDDVKFARVNFTYKREIEIDDTRKRTVKTLLDAARVEADRVEGEQ